MPTSDESPIREIFFSFVPANGIRHRLASNVRHLDRGGSALAKSKGYPLVLFLHGFPECWYSWRHQLVALRDRPFLAVAPDMRGCGSTSPPKSTGIEEYTQPVLARDVIEIAKYLGYNEFVVVGHDWGAMLAWSVALLYPQNVTGVVGLSVPYAGTPKKGLLTMLQNAYGKCLDPSLPREVIERAKFHYILHHCLPKCEEEYAKNTESFLYRVYAYRKRCKVEPGTPECDPRGLMFPPTGDVNFDRTRTLDATSSPGWWNRIPCPVDLPSWLTREDLEYIVGEFKRSGFLGGISWYRAADMNFKLMRDLLKSENGGHGDKVLPPSMFLIGDDDALVKFYGGKNKVQERLKESLLFMIRDPIFVPGCGHWIQQEEAQLVNDALLDFLDRVTTNRRSKL
jgi:pimeloyl-ACP methyl ester carboxylesterase